MEYLKVFLAFLFLLSPLEINRPVEDCNIDGFASQAMSPSSQRDIYKAIPTEKIGAQKRFEGLALAGDTCHWKGDSILLDYVTVLYYDSLKLYTISCLQLMQDAANGTKEYKAIWTDSLAKSLSKLEVSKTFYLHRNDRLLVTQNPGSAKAKYWSHYPIINDAE